jgi:hypothetical protein
MFQADGRLFATRRLASGFNLSTPIWVGRGLLLLVAFGMQPAGKNQALRSAREGEPGTRDPGLQIPEPFGQQPPPRCPHAMMTPLGELEGASGIAMDAVRCQ